MVLVLSSVMCGFSAIKSNKVAAMLAFLCASFLMPALSHAGSEYSLPWRNKTRAVILDAYEKNPIDWQKLATNKQIVGFIGKSSDGLPPSWSCRKRNKIENTLCRKTFQNYWLKKELYKTRRMVAKNIGMKWGAYHLGRPGNPIAQANHFIDFTNPSKDDLLALDIEHDDPKKWISLKDAETFVKHVKFRTGRYPVLYTNHDTAKRIAARRAELPILSRLPLWYARYRSNINGVFPMGHWESYAIWQFSSRSNCNKRRCLYRVNGTQTDIDVNVADTTIAELDKAWPYGELVPARDEPKPEVKPEAPTPDTSGEGILLVSNETEIEVKPFAKKAAPKTVLRYATDLKFETKDGGVVRLASIAVPSPRKPVAIELGLIVETAPTLVATLQSEEATSTSLSIADLNSAVRKSSIDAHTVAAISAVDAETNYVRSIRAERKRPVASYGYSNKLRPSKFH